ncbi:MAG: hypothetical protein ACPLZ9_04350 [Candidatus Ratteibacteria bacterium]
MNKNKEWEKKLSKMLDNFTCNRLNDFFIEIEQEGFDKFIFQRYQGPSFKELEKIINKIVDKICCLNDNEILECIKMLFSKIATTDKCFTPSSFEIIRTKEKNLNKIDFQCIYSFLRYFILMESVNKCISNPDIILSLIKKANTFEEKRLAIYVIKNTKKIPWKNKKDIFWEWRENPLFSLNEDLKYWDEFSPPMMMDNEIMTQEKIKSYAPSYFYFCDLLFLLKEINSQKDKKNRQIDKKEKEKFRKKIFGVLEREIETLNSRTYEDFIKNSQSRQKLQCLLRLLETAEFWNKIVSGIIPIDHENRKKNEELGIILQLLSLGKIKYKIVCLQRPNKEPPDYVLYTENHKIIGIEYTRYDEEYEIKRADQELCEPMYLSNTRSKEFAKKLAQIIKEKIKKLKFINRNSYNEIWLCLYPTTASAAIREIESEIASQFFNTKMFKEYLAEYLTNQELDFFNEIFLISIKEGIIDLKRTSYV